MYKRMRNGLLMAVAVVLSVACAATPPKPAPTDTRPATKAQVHELMRVVGVAHLMKTTLADMNKQVSVSLESQFPCVPKGYWSHFMGANARQQMLDLMVPIYQKHFTRSDVAQMLKFYRTPLGQKVIHEMPAVMHDAMKAGQQWGRMHVMKMMVQLRSNGVLNDQDRCVAMPPPPPHPPKLSGKS